MIFAEQKRKSLWRIDGCNILFTNFYLKNKVIIRIYRLHTIGTDKSPYSVRIQENTNQKQLRIWTLFMQCHFSKIIYHKMSLKQFLCAFYWGF